VDAIVRDYVKWWYSPIVPTDDAFPAACRQTLTAFISSAATHLGRKRPVDTLLDFLTNSSSIVIVFLSELSRALVASQASDVSVGEAVDDYLFSHPESSLAHMLSEKEQSKKFHTLADDVLFAFLEKSTYQCVPVRTFLREIIATVVMQTSLNAFSKPEWINGWIVYLLEGTEPELNHAIDVGMGNTSEEGDGDMRGRNTTSQQRRSEEKGHRKRLSKAEEAMEEAIEEANRLNQLIADEERRRSRSQEESAKSTSREEAPADFSSSINLRRQRDEPQSGHCLDGVLDSVRDDPIPASHASVVPIMDSPFTTFDQILPRAAIEAGEPQPRHVHQSQRLTLHNASISLMDDSPQGSERGQVRSKPTWDYFVQIEPRLHPGWMTIRRFEDFETLHEILKRLAPIIPDGVSFMEQHHTLPDYRLHTSSSLRGELERYLRDALWHRQLAESEGMKRFLEKDQGDSLTSSTRSIGWPTPAAFENMGKGMLEILTSAPKGAAEGSKAVLGGMSGVLGNIGAIGTKMKENINTGGVNSPSKLSLTTPKSNTQILSPALRQAANSDDRLRASTIVHMQPGKIAPMERKPSYTSITSSEVEGEALARERVSISSRSSISGRPSTTNSRAPSRAPSISTRNLMPELDDLILPPPPSDIPDDYMSTVESTWTGHSRTDSVAATVGSSISTAPSLVSPSRPPLKSRIPNDEHKPMSEAETKVAIELLFAIVNELYTLSSAWNIRRTLLTAAKTFLLRPGNPSLATIQTLIQESLIGPNTSDNGVAEQLRKLRANTLPTEEELKAWPRALTWDEKEQLRSRAKKLLVEKGMPAALTGVMGQAATGEALGRLFDCLQVEEVARGLMFGLLLQGVKAIVH
jgi:hypothetical protein